MSRTIILTGSNGTIGKALKKHFEANGFSVIPWNREKVPIDNYFVMEKFIKTIQPIALIHLAAITSFEPEKRKDAWLVNYEWPSEIAWICMIHKIKFIFTSTAMVFSHLQKGPFTIDSVPDANNGYGYEKRMAEERVMSQNPESVILRLGWQIALEGHNSMIRFLENEMNEKGFIEASTNWFPSCSFLEDTIEIFRQSLNFEPGIYMLNANEKLSFFEIACFLNEKFHKSWIIKPVESPVLDQRMEEKRLRQRLRLSK